jgi:hypothetical protein
LRDDQAEAVQRDRLPADQEVINLLGGEFRQ